MMITQPTIIEEMSEYNGERRLYVETRLENWNDFFKLYNRFLMASVYRGHGCAKWSMTSSLERMVKRSTLITSQIFNDIRLKN